jgi:hypothetical protein
MKIPSFFLAAAIFFLLLSPAVFADSIPPAAPRGFDAAGGANIGEIVLTWTNPADADLAGIEVYFAATGGYSASLYQTIAVEPNAKGTFTFVNLGTSTEYYIFLKSVDSSGNKSVATTEIKRTTATSSDSTSPAAATGFTATDLTTGGAIKLAWINPPDGDFFQTRIHRAEQADFTPTSQNQIAVVFGIPSAVGEYADSGLTNGQVYYYKIRAEDNRGNIQSGLFYPSASAMPTLVAPSPTPTPSLSPTPSPTISPTPGPIENIPDGGLMRQAGTFDIYIAKIAACSSIALCERGGSKKFKRLILNPEIFNSYGHLKWSDVRNVSASTMAAYQTSDLVIEVNPDGSIANSKVYRISSAADSDVGQKQWLNVTASQFEAAGLDWDSIYKINRKEASADFYQEGENIDSL